MCALVCVEVRGLELGLSCCFVGPEILGGGGSSMYTITHASACRAISLDLKSLNKCSRQNENIQCGDQKPSLGKLI